MDKSQTHTCNVCGQKVDEKDASDFDTENEVCCYCQGDPDPEGTKGDIECHRRREEGE